MRLCLWTAASNRAVVHPTGDIWEWSIMVEWYWQENRRTQKKACPSDTLSTTNPTWTDLDINLVLRFERPVTNCLSHVTASSISYWCWQHMAAEQVSRTYWSWCQRVKETVGAMGPLHIFQQFEHSFKLKFQHFLSRAESKEVSPLLFISYPGFLKNIGNMKLIMDSYYN
jgi:hypothetical protein